MPNGWLDLKGGPYGWYRSRWCGGPHWRRVWIRFFMGRSGVTVQSHAQKGGLAIGGGVLAPEFWDVFDYRHREDWVMGWVRKLQRPEGGSDGGGDASDADWLRDFPALHEYICATRHVDGAARRTSTVTIFAEHGAFKLWLNERDIGASLCATGATVGEALTALEIMLEGETVPWRWEAQEGKQGPRKGRRGS